MKVKELIKELEFLPENMEIVVYAGEEANWLSSVCVDNGHPYTRSGTECEDFDEELEYVFLMD